ncbi:hemerythrin [Pusillimonas caeni]|uniref:bacteriohemerythrin n=1 Tax=Pusillimonas caeni TaxID=1348472 RepID=UPI000E59B235|nr:hemerythrin domain-containing protein [Pusillimonas caeni]TFL15658.1 hemerythrin [Pusillimonas caeni]
MSEARKPLLRDPNAPAADSDTSFLWSDTRLLGYQPMDDVHKEFYEVTFGLLVCTDETAGAALEAFAQHAQSHFDQEDEWMRSTDFPARDCHIEEHAAVLGSVREARELLKRGVGGAAMLQDFGAYLFSWFPGHADYLDSALAAWMVKRKMGGKPVVLRRDMNLR